MAAFRVRGRALLGGNDLVVGARLAGPDLLNRHLGRRDEKKRREEVGEERRMWLEEKEQKQAQRFWPARYLPIPALGRPLRLWLNDASGFSHRTS